MNKKYIAQTDDNNVFLIMLPVFYEFENRPAWRKVFKGTKEECEKEFELYPDSIKATAEENKNNRQWKMKEFLFLQSIGKKKEAEKIRLQYNF